MRSPRLAPSDAGEAFKKAASYLRYSTESQRDSYSLSIQKSEIDRYLSQHPELRVVRTYVDEARSGSDLCREGLQSLLSDAGKKEFSVVLVSRADRLSRDLFSALFVEKTLLQHGVEVFSCNEPLHGRDAVSVALRNMTAIFAQLERELIRDRLLAGRKQRLLAGNFPGGRPAFGYDVVDGALVINSAEAAIVKEARRLRCGRHSYSAIARTLNERGFRSKLGKLFRHNSIRYILSNKVYRSVVKYGEERPGLHPPLR